MEMNSQLERKNNYLKLKESVLLEHLSQSRILYKDLWREHERVVQAHITLKVHYSRIKEEYKKFLKKREQEQLCLARVMESSARLENQNIDLLFQMDTLRCSMHQLKEMLVEAHF